PVDGHASLLGAIMVLLFSKVIGVLAGDGGGAGDDWRASRRDCPVDGHASLLGAIMVLLFSKVIGVLAGDGGGAG
ncbi:hypothetical protein CKJ89_38420, partial [Klebsiella pneumoniae]